MIRGYNDPREQAARTVYKDLWARGLTIGTGNPYGVDFTVYEGALSQQHVCYTDVSNKLLNGCSDALVPDVYWISPFCMCRRPDGLPFVRSRLCDPWGLPGVE